MMTEGNIHKWSERRVLTSDNDSSEQEELIRNKYKCCCSGNLPKPMDELSEIKNLDDWY